MCVWCVALKVPQRGPIGETRKRNEQEAERTVDQRRD